MKKFLSLLLTLCLFLTPVHAMAEGTCTQVQISDISLAFGDLENPITLGMSMLLTMLSGDKGASLSLSVNDGQNNSLAAGGISMDANGMTVLIDGMQSAFHLSYEAIAALYPEEAGMSLNQLGMLSNHPVTANKEELVNPFAASAEDFTAFAEHLTSICIEVLGEAEQTPIGIETVSVFDAEYDLQRVDLTIPAEGIQKICLTLLDEVAALATVSPDQLAEARDKLAGIDQGLTMRLWNNEERSVGRIETDIPAQNEPNGEYMTYLVGEFVNTETEGMNFQISILDGSTIEEGFYYSKDPSGATQYGFYADVLDADGDVEETLDLYFGSGTYEDSDTVYAVFSNTDALGTAEFGCNYIYQDLSSDAVEQYGGNFVIWFDTYDDQMVQTNSNSLHFALDIVRGSYDTDGTLSPQGITSIVEIDQMSDKDIQQAQTELLGVLQKFLMGAVSDPGVQQLIILFSGMFDFTQSHNM